MSNQVATTELKGFDLKAIEQGLARLQEVDAKMEVFKEKVLTVSIADMEDKKGYEAVKSLRGEMRKERTPLEDERKTAVKPLNELVKQVNTKYKEYIDGYSELEGGLKTQEEGYTTFHENKKLEEEQAKEKAIEVKINLLIESGLEYSADNGYYKNDRGIAINRQSLITMSEEDFTAVALKAKERKFCNNINSFTRP